MESGGDGSARRRGQAVGRSYVIDKSRTRRRLASTPRGLPGPPSDARVMGAVDTPTRQLRIVVVTSAAASRGRGEISPPPPPRDDCSQRATTRNHSTCRAGRLVLADCTCNSRLETARRHGPFCAELSKSRSALPRHGRRAAPRACAVHAKAAERLGGEHPRPSCSAPATDGAAAALSPWPGSDHRPCLTGEHRQISALTARGGPDHRLVGTSGGTRRARRGQNERGDSARQEGKILRVLGLLQGERSQTVRRRLASSARAGSADNPARIKLTQKKMLRSKSPRRRGEELVERHRLLSAEGVGIGIRDCRIVTAPSPSSLNALVPNPSSLYIALQ